MSVISKKIQALKQELNLLEGLRIRLDAMNATFGLRWKADMRAIKMWQKSTGKKFIWPDHADLCVWLMGELDKLRYAADRIYRTALISNKDNPINRDWVIETLLPLLKEKQSQPAPRKRGRAKKQGSPCSSGRAPQP